MAIKTLTINRFENGINTDIDRDLTNGYWKLLENVEFTPRGAKQIVNVSSTTNDKNICSLIDMGGTVVGLGWINGTTKNVTIWDVTNNTSIMSSSYVFTANARPFFVYIDGYYYYQNNTKVGKYGAAPNEDWADISGLKGGLAWQTYLFGWKGQDVYKIASDGSFVKFTALIPTGLTCVEILDLGKTLGIVCDGGTSGDSKMLIWDGVTTADTDFYDTPKIGSGYVRGAGMLDGVPYVVVNSFNYREIKIKQYNGTTFQTIYNYEGHYNLEATPRNINPVSRVIANQGYLYMLVLGTEAESTSTSGFYIARYGRKVDTLPMAFSIYKSLSFTPTSVQWPSPYGDFVVKNDNSSVDAPIVASVWDTTNTMKIIQSGSTYSAQAGALETGIITGDSHIQKSLMGFSIMHDPLPAGGSVACMYKIGNGTAWTTFMTSDTDGEVSKECLNIEATGENLDSFKELKLRFEVLGGAELTGIITKYEEENNNL
jgi:hypothetical protein